MAVISVLLAALLPLAPQPVAPFPKIITDAPTIQRIAPGVLYGDYEMLTADGPLSVHVVAIDAHEGTIRLGTALAQNRLVSGGETVSSMAARTGAVAGINGDYFDINQTNQPLNILVEDSRLIRVPMKRWALAVSQDRSVSFDEYQLAVSAALPAGPLPIDTMNDWPPRGEHAIFITPEYGALRAAPDVTELALDPTYGTPPFATYRVRSVADNTAVQPPGYYLAIANDGTQTDPPRPGDAVSISGQTTPSIDGIASAIGGGPLLVKDGAWYADPDGPSGGEFATHMPATAAAVTASGDLLLFEIDGRQPELSIGVLQPQLAALLIAFGAQTGMQFDGGGSSTIVARLPGDQNARVQNSPSDGVERHVGDALLVYSDAPNGPPSRVNALPQEVRAVPGARVPLAIAITDEAGHTVSCDCEIRMHVVPGSAGAIVGNTFVAGNRTGSAEIDVAAGALREVIPVSVTTDVARAQILPLDPDVPENGRIALQARAFDARGYPIALPSALPWSASNGTIDDRGVLDVRTGDAFARVRLGDRTVVQQVTVGEHVQDLGFARAAQFSTAPRGGPGSLALGDPCPSCLALRYDFTGTERAAYAGANLVLPQRALGISADVYGDGNDEILRLSVHNAINEQFLYTMATVNWRGWKHIEFRFPAGLPQPITLRSIYAIDRVGPQTPVKAAGQISLRDVRVILAGSEQNVPK